MQPNLRHFIFITGLIAWSTMNQVYGLGRNSAVSIFPVDSVSNVFIRIQSSKLAAYTGEPIIVKYVLYNSVTVTDPQSDTDLKFRNCYQEQYPAEQQQHQEKINGKTYNVVVLKQYLVIASNVGKLILPQLKTNIKLNSVSDNDFFGQEKLVTKQIYSNAASVTINDKPTFNSNVPFTGAVGDFKVSCLYRPSKQNTNLLFFQLTIEGSGNTKAINFAPPLLSKGLDAYNTNISRADILAVDDIKTKVVYTCQIVANYRGTYTLSPVNFAYFDPGTGQYKKYISDTYHWQVNTGPVLFNKPVQNMLVKNSTSDENNLVPFSYSGAHLFFIITGFILLMYCLKPQRYNNFLIRYADVLMARNAKRRAIARVKKTAQRSSALNDDLFYRELSAIFYKYVQEKHKGLVLDDIFFETELRKLRLPATIYNQIITCLNNLQSIRFGVKDERSLNRSIQCDELIVVINAFSNSRYE